VRPAVFLLLLLTAPAIFAQEDESARQVLDDCASSLEEGVTGIDAIEVVCPGLEDALMDLGLAPFIATWQWETVGVSGLKTLQAVERRYRDTPEAAAVSIDSLRPVLDSLQKSVQVEQSLSWFERFKRWLRGAVDEPGADVDSWLTRWLNDHELSATARAIIFYGAVILVVLLALIVIVNEIRVARRARRNAKRTQADNVALGQHGSMAADAMDLDVAARDDRPSIVLRMLVATLVKTGRLHAARSLTHSELATRAKFDHATQRQSFQRVAQLAERIVYGGDSATTADFEEIVQEGRTLNDQLAGASS
jgi:hypothetical protein